MAKNIDYKAPLRGLGLLIAKLLTQLAGVFLPKIKDDEIRLMATGLLNSSKETVEALSDADPADKEQLLAVFNKLFKDGPFRQGAKAELVGKINELTNENVRIVLQFFNNQAYTVADLLTDADPANSDQVEEMLRNILRSQDGIIVLRGLVGIVLKNEAYANLIAFSIIQLLLTAIEDEENPNPVVAGQLIALQKKYEQSVAA